MSPEQKIVQYLNEAHASELALTRVLQSQIAMTPRGSLPLRAGDAPRPRRSDHARPRREAGCRSSARAPTRCRPSSASRRASSGRRSRSARRRSTSLRGSGGEEKVLKNAKDAAATEALEIATYTSIERLAKVVGDDKTAQLAASILADEEKMLARVLREIPQADRRRDRRQGRFDVATREPAPARPSRRASEGDQAGRPPDPQGPGRRAGRGPGQGRRRLRGRSRDRALRRADRRRDHAAGCPSSRRSTWPRSIPTSAGTRTAPRCSTAISSLRGDEPWPGYDELNVSEIRSALAEADDDRLRDRPHVRARAQGPHERARRRRARADAPPDTRPARGA